MERLVTGSPCYLTITASHLDYSNQALLVKLRNAIMLSRYSYFYRFFTFLLLREIRPDGLQDICTTLPPNLRPAVASRRCRGEIRNTPEMRTNGIHAWLSYLHMEIVSDGIGKARPGSRSPLAHSTEHLHPCKLLLRKKISVHSRSRQT
jgi:hypothetical protein